VLNKPAQENPDNAAFAILFAWAMTLILSATITLHTWKTGVFADTDDAARMVQIRDWMAGQAWYDLKLHRMGLPDAPFMHWTRIVDIPIAGLIRFFELFLDQTAAERIARIVFPLSLIAVLLMTASLILRELLLRNMLVPGLLIVALSGISTGHLRPGRIDHHGPQVLLFLIICLFLLRSMNKRAPFLNGLLCGGIASLSQAISLENLPLIFVAAAIFALRWMIHGENARSAFRGFSAGLFAATPILFLLTTPPENWLAPLCDAQSIVHVLTFSTIAATCLILTSTAPFLPTLPRRTTALVLAGIPGLILVLSVFPQCADPYSAIDPLVRRLWLDNVTEAESLFEAISGDFGTIFPQLGPGIAGFAGAVFCALKTKAAQREKWIVIIAMTGAALVVSAYKVTGLASLSIIGAIGITGALDHLPDSYRRFRNLFAIAFSGIGVFALVPAQPIDPYKMETFDCLAPEAYASLDKLPTGLILAHINFGAHILAHTNHSTVAAPYHRNNEGNRISVEVFQNSSKINPLHVIESGADYIVICQGTGSSKLEAAFLEAFPKLELIDRNIFSVWRMTR
jgi:hypothetical protein